MDQIDEPDGTEPPEAHRLIKGEHRLLPTATILVLIVLPFLLPEALSQWAVWVLAAAGVILLVALLLADPGRIDRRDSVIRGLSIALLMLLVLLAMLATFTLVKSLLDGSSEFSTPGPLLLTGLLVWLDTTLTFALLYWELDGGGAAQRLHNRGKDLDFAFVEHVNPELAPAGWLPTMGDYLFLAHTNALAFSPTDVMPLTQGAKFAMALQSLISLAILTLVIATAVNLLN